MSINDDVKVLGRKRARDLKAVSLREQIEIALEGINEVDDIEQLRLRLTVALEGCLHLLEKEIAAQ
jgi:hypothetical protein